MSFQAMRFVADTKRLTPTQKLILFQIASYHNDITGQCNPHPDRLALDTGLSPVQIQKITRQLIDAGQIGREAHNFTFPGLVPAAPAAEIPSDFWPSQEAIESLVTSYPQHDFSMEDAVNDFIAYCHTSGRHPAHPDLAFVRATSAILDRRRPGPVTFQNGKGRDQDNSVGAYLGGRAHTARSA